MVGRLVGCAFIKDKGKQYFTRGDILSLCLCLSNILSQNRVSCQGTLVGFSLYVFDNFNGFQMRPRVPVIVPIPSAVLWSVGQSATLLSKPREIIVFGANLNVFCNAI